MGSARLLAPVDLLKVLPAEAIERAAEPVVEPADEGAIEPSEVAGSVVDLLIWRRAQLICWRSCGVR